MINSQPEEVTQEEGPLNRNFGLGTECLEDWCVAYRGRGRGWASGLGLQDWSSVRLPAGFMDS